MEEPTRPSSRATLPVVLIAALVEGWGLYGLHHAIKAHQWPATDQAWLTALYCVTIFGPLTVQLLAGQVRNRPAWMMVAAITGAFFYFGWHQGATQLPDTEGFNWWQGCFAFALPLIVLWLHLLPFVQGRLEVGSWRVPYTALFSHAWRNYLALAEASLFTALLWLLLELWQSLFEMLDIRFFHQLFEEPIFVYPVTAITFGIALHLIGSIDRLTSVVLEQLLNVLKWLAVVAGSLLALFTLALVLKLPGSFSGGERIIRAAWLLWLVAVVVLLLNAAFRDGSVDRPYPGWIAAALRFTVPLTVVIAVTAVYALFVRTQQYGISVERAWAYIVSGAALLYSVGYSLIAFNRGPWMAGMARVNVIVALVLMLVVAITLTPALAPRRLAADSQFRLILSHPLPATEARPASDSPFSYLRFEAGTYGLERLRQLAVITGRPQAEDIRRTAAAAQAMKHPWEAAVRQGPDFRKSLSNLNIYPSGRTLEPALVEALVARQKLASVPSLGPQCPSDNCVGVFVDLNSNGVDEFVLLQPGMGWLFERREGNWLSVGRMQVRGPMQSWDRLRDALAKGEFSAVAPQWNIFSVAGQEFEVNDPN